MPRTARLAVGGPAGETTDFGADHKFSPLGTHATYCNTAVCTEMPAPPTGRALLLGGGPVDPPSSRALLLGGGSRPPQQQSAPAGGGSAMGLGVQGGYRAVCGRSNEREPVHEGG